MESVFVGLGIIGIGYSAYHVTQTYKKKGTRALFKFFLTFYTFMSFAGIPMFFNLWLLKRAYSAKAAWESGKVLCNQGHHSDNIFQWYGEKNICSDAANHNRTVFSIWFDLASEKMGLAMWTGSTLAEMVDALSNENSFVAITKLVIVFGTPVFVLASWTYILSTSKKENTAWEEGDKICVKLPNGEKTCFCKHTKTPVPGSGPSEPEKHSSLQK